MDDLRTLAQLVDFDRAGAIGTVVSRAEIAEAAAGDEFPATLLLDLERDDAAQATVAVDWDQETLEKLLASMEDQEIGLWFDESALSLAFDDVEGHGLREKAAVLAVSVAAAGVSTSPALARMQAEPGGGGSVAQTTVVAPNPAADKRAVVQGAERALQQDRQLSQNLSVDSATPVAPDPAGDKQAVMQGAERALQQDRQVSQSVNPDEATATSSTSTLSTGELAGAIAGGALLIAAAGFGVARKRTPPAQPA